MIRRFTRVSRRRKLAVIKATGLLLLARGALIVMPFSSVARIAERSLAVPRSESGDRELRAMLWAIQRVGNRLFPTNPCLPQAIVAQRELKRAGRPAELRISVRKDRSGRFGAHAWVESEGRILMGGEVLSEEFVPLPALPSDGSEG